MSESAVSVVSQDVVVPQLDRLNVVFERYPNPEMMAIHLNVRLVAGNEEAEYSHDSKNVIQVRRFGNGSEYPFEPLAQALAIALYDGVPGIDTTNFINLSIGSFRIQVPKGRAFDDTLFEANVLAVLAEFFNLTNEQIVTEVANPYRDSYERFRGYSELDEVAPASTGNDLDGDAYAAILSDYSDPAQLKAALMPYAIIDPEERSVAIAKTEDEVPVGLADVAVSKAGRRAIVDRLAELGALTRGEAFDLLSGGNDLDDLDPDYVHLLQKDASSYPTA